MSHNKLSIFVLLGSLLPFATGCVVGTDTLEDEAESIDEISEALSYSATPSWTTNSGGTWTNLFVMDVFTIDQSHVMFHVKKQSGAFTGTGTMYLQWRLAGTNNAWQNLKDKYGFLIKSDISPGVTDIYVNDYWQSTYQFPREYRFLYQSISPSGSAWVGPIKINKIL